MWDPEVDALIDGVDEESNDETPSLDLREVHGGVSLTWLSQVFRMDKQTVKKRLALCPPVRMLRGNSPVFDLAQAASFLVTPRVDIAEYIKSLKPENLPTHLQKEYWDALLKRQQWQARAGELWPTEDVLSVLGEAFKHLKTTMQLFVDNLDRAHSLSPEQRKSLTQMVDALQNDMHEQLVQMPQQRSTYSLKGPPEDADASDAV